MPAHDKNKIQPFNEIDSMYVDWYLKNYNKRVLTAEERKAVDESFNRMFAPVQVPKELAEVLNVL